MGSTTRFGLHYLGLSDAPDIAGATELLAEDTDGWLCRAYPVANAAARTAISSPPEGFLVRQRDDGSVWVRTDLGAWSQINGSGGGVVGGGSSGSASYGAWSATSVQTIPTGSSTITPLALGNEDLALAGVTRSSKGAGHKFTCVAGTYLATATVRFAAGAEGSRFISLRAADDSAQYWSDQDSGSAVTTRTFTGPVLLGATTDLYVAVSQSSGSGLATVPTSSVTPSGFVKFSLLRLGS